MTRWRRFQKAGVRPPLTASASEMSFESLESSFIDSFVLDQSLISDVEENNSHQRIVRAAIAMAQGLDIEVAAGGVETISQLDFPRSRNCDLAQGFLISQPMQAEKVAQVLRPEVAGQRLWRDVVFEGFLPGIRERRRSGIQPRSRLEAAPTSVTLIELA